MRNKTFFLYIFIILIYSLSYVKALNNPLLGKVIFIDPGHGGLDPGAINKISEKDLNLEISLELKDKLEKYGSKVLLTRNGDYDLSSKYSKNKKLSDLSKRVKMINNSNADLYLSIHLNADKNKNYKGIQIFYNNKNKNNIILAKTMQKTFQNKLNIKRKEKIITDRYLYRNVTKPGILLELGFITNDYELNKLQKKDYQNKLVNIIIDGLINYFNCQK